MKRLTFAAFAALALLAGPALASAETMHRWVDEDGKVHFGKNPPQGVESEEIRSYNPPPGGQETRPEPPTPRREQERKAPDSDDEERRNSV